MALTLDDILGAPTDPEELNQHLLTRGLIAPPPAPEAPAPLVAPATVTAPLSPVVSHPELANMKPPNITKGPGAPDWTAEEVAHAGHPITTIRDTEIGGSPEIGGGTPIAGSATPDIIKPMKPPAAPTRGESIEAGKEEFKANRPGITAAPGTADFWQQKLAQDEYDKAHPWGSDVSAHPGLLGKILHGAGLVGQIAGGAVNPGLVAEIPGTRLNREAREGGEQQQLGAAQTRESENATRDVQQREGEQRIKEGEQKLTKEQTEQSLEKDAEGNITGWKGPDGKLHSLDEEGTPQAIKDIAEATQNKPHFEKSENGDIVSITPGKDGQPAKADVVYKGNPKMKTEIRGIVDPATGHSHDQIIDVTPGSPTFGTSLKDLGRSKEDKPESPTAALTKEKAGERVVLAYDKDGKSHLMSRNDAEEEGMQHITAAQSADIDKAKTHHVVLNTLQTQLNSVVNSSKALDQGLVQRGIIASALSHPSNTTIDSAMRAAVLSGATEQTKDYVQSVLALREAGLALPKEITGGSRVAEIQASALWQTMPSAGSLDSKYALKQAKKFQQDIDRLRERAPEVRGLSMVDPDDAIKSKGQEKEHKTGEAAAGPAAAPPAGKVSVIAPDGTPHWANEKTVDEMLKDPKYKGWKRAPGR